jgi:hypothetical protein
MMKQTDQAHRIKMARLNRFHVKGQLSIAEEILNSELQPIPDTESG